MGNTASASGASGGIGAELAKIYLSKGGGLVLVVRSKDTLDALESEIESAHSIKIVVMADDIAKPDSGADPSEATETNDIQIGSRINEDGICTHEKVYAHDLTKDHATMHVNMDFLSDLTHLYLQGLTNKDCRKN